MLGDSCLRNANIVVADDDRIARQSVAKLLRSLGAQVVSVADGESAIQAVRNGPVDLVVLDVGVAGPSAMDTSRAIERVSRSGFIPIFLLTQSRNIDGQAQGLRMGADEYIAKPFENAEFLARVRNVLRVKRGRSDGEASKGHVPAHADQRDEVALVPDQRHFRARVEQELKHAERHLEPFACCMIAVDDFRELISELGAGQADAVLLALSKLLRRSVRESDVVARFRTAEFGLLLPNTSLAGALTLCDRLMGKVHSERSLRERAKQARISLGIGTYPDAKARTARELIDAASLAVARARSVGPNHVCCLQQPGYLFRPKLPSLA